MVKKKGTILQRVKQWVNATNILLSKNKLRVTGGYVYIEGERCVEVILEGDFIYQNKLELMCSHTDTSLHAVTLYDGRVCFLLRDKQNNFYESN